MTFSASISCQKWWEILQEVHETLRDAYIETGIHQIMYIPEHNLHLSLSN